MITFDFFWDLLSVSLVGFVIYPFLRFVESNDISWIWMGIGLLLADGSTKVIKQLTHPLGSVFLRPDGATKCDILCATGNSSGAPGFPSGHVTAITFFFVYMWLKYRSTKLAILGLVVILLVAAARIQKRCHNDVQVIAGAAWGAIFAVAWYKAAENLLHQKAQ